MAAMESSTKPDSLMVSWRPLFGFFLVLMSIVLPGATWFYLQIPANGTSCYGGTTNGVPKQSRMQHYGKRIIIRHAIGTWQFHLQQPSLPLPFHLVSACLHSKKDKIGCHQSPVALPHRVDGDGQCHSHQQR